MVNLTTLVGAVGAAVVVGLGASEIKSRNDHVATIQDAIGNPQIGQTISIEGIVSHIAQSQRVRGYESLPVTDYLIECNNTEALYHISTTNPDKFGVMKGDTISLTGTVANAIQNATIPGVYTTTTSINRFGLALTDDQRDRAITLNYVSQNK